MTKNEGIEAPEDKLMLYVKDDCVSCLELVNKPRGTTRNPASIASPLAWVWIGRVPVVTRVGKASLNW